MSYLITFTVRINFCCHLTETVHNLQFATTIQPKMWKSCKIMLCNIGQHQHQSQGIIARWLIGMIQELLSRLKMFFCLSCNLWTAPYQQTSQTCPRWVSHLAKERHLKTPQCKIYFHFFKTLNFHQKMCRWHWPWHLATFLTWMMTQLLENRPSFKTKYFSKICWNIVVFTSMWEFAISSDIRLDTLQW